MAPRHTDRDLIDADFALSERIGAEIIAAGCEPLPNDRKPLVRRTYTTRRRFSATAAGINIEHVTICVVETIER